MDGTWTWQMRRLQMRTEGTTLGRVMMLASDFEEIVTNNGREETFNSREWGKLEVKILLAAVRPYLLRQKMQELVDVSEPKLQKSPDEFLDRLKEKVVSHVEWEESDERPPKKKRSEFSASKKHDQK